MSNQETVMVSTEENQGASSKIQMNVTGQGKQK